MAEFNGKSDEEIRQIVVEAFGEEFRKESDQVDKELLSESPRASVLVGAAWLEEYLAEFIALALPQDAAIRDVFLSPIRSLGQRIDVANKLGIIGNTEKEALHIIRTIRNKFAHHTSVSFVDNDIAALTAKLGAYLPPSHSPEPSPAEEGRSKYVSTIATYVASIVARINYAKSLGDLETQLKFLRFVADESDKESTA